MTGDSPPHIPEAAYEWEIRCFAAEPCPSGRTVRWMSAVNHVVEELALLPPCIQAEARIVRIPIEDLGIDPIGLEVARAHRFRDGSVVWTHMYAPSGVLRHGGTGLR